MEVRNCTTCGKMFNSVMDIKRCPACRKADETKFKMIKEYLYDMPGATIEEVAENLDIDRGSILNFLREGRLETIGENMVISCENCGAPIHSGKFCDKCSREMTMNLKSAAKTLHKDPNSKGFYSTKKKK